MTPWWGRAAEAVLLPLAALLAAGAAYSVVLLVLGQNPVTVYRLMYLGGFGTWFSWQHTLLRAAPLLLTGLCMALPSRMGLAVIGGEGAFVLAGLAAVEAARAAASLPAALTVALMLAAGMATGAALLAFAGLLRVWRGVNETIGSLLLNYMAIAVFDQLIQGPLRDPEDLNRPSSHAIPADAVIGTMPGGGVHWGLAVGLGCCVAAWLLIEFTGFGFALRVAGGNARTARMVGIPVARLALIVCALGGAAAGLAGAIQVAAVEQRASSSLIAGFGYTGILVSFLARHDPIGIIPVAVLLGGIGASGELLQIRLGLPYAGVLALQGTIFICVLVAETLRGRMPFQPFRVPEAAVPAPGEAAP